MTIRPPPRTAFEFAERGWRPSLMWILLLTIAIPFGLMLAAVMAAYAYGVWRAMMTGEPVPNFLGGLENLPWQYIAGGLGALFTGYLARGRQVVRELEAGGGQGRPPFGESSPPPSAQTPAGPSPDDWPRPQETIPP